MDLFNCEKHFWHKRMNRLWKSAFKIDDKQTFLSVPFKLENSILAKVLLKRFEDNFELLLEHCGTMQGLCSIIWALDYESQGVDFNLKDQLFRVLLAWSLVKKYNLSCFTKHIIILGLLMTTNNVPFSFQEELLIHDYSKLGLNFGEFYDFLTYDCKNNDKYHKFIELLNNCESEPFAMFVQQN